MLPTSAWGLNPRPPGLQSDGASNWATEAGFQKASGSFSFNNCVYAYDDYMTRFAASDLGLYCLLLSFSWDARHKWFTPERDYHWIKNTAFYSILFDIRYTTTVSTATSGWIWYVISLVRQATIERNWTNVWLAQLLYMRVVRTTRSPVPCTVRQSVLVVAWRTRLDDPQLGRQLYVCRSCLPLCNYAKFFICIYSH